MKLKTILAIGLVAGTLACAPAKQAYRFFKRIARKPTARYVVGKQDGNYFLTDKQTGDSKRIDDGLVVGNKRHLLKGIDGIVGDDPIDHEEFLQEMQDYSDQKIREANQGFPTANGYSDPYALKLEREKTFEGGKSYLVNTTTNESLPVYEGMHVGNNKHRIKGFTKALKEYLGKHLQDIFSSDKNKS